MAGGSTRWRGRSVISKVASLLDAFTAETLQLTLGELAERTGLPMSTTYRLAAELVAWGALERADGGAGYRLGTRLGELGALAPRREELRAVARPFMQDLHDATQVCVRLAVIEGQRARYVETISDGRSPPASFADFGELPLHATSVGKVLLAHAPESLVSEVLQADLHRFTPHTLTAPTGLRRALGDVRRTGLAYEREELALGEESVASAVVGADRTPVAALAAVRFSTRGNLNRLGPAVRTAAISISRAWREQSPADDAGTGPAVSTALGAAGGATNGRLDGGRFAGVAHGR